MCNQNIVQSRTLSPKSSECNWLGVSGTSMIIWGIRQCCWASRITFQKLFKNLYIPSFFGCFGCYNSDTKPLTVSCFTTWHWYPPGEGWWGKTVCGNARCAHYNVLGGVAIGVISKMPGSSFIYRKKTENFHKSGEMTLLRRNR